MVSAVLRRLGACTAAAAMLSAAQAFAAGLDVTLHSVNGTAVANAVITAEPLAGHAPAAAPVTVVVDQKGKLFRPWVTVVPVGARLVFANHDDITHHVYSFSRAKRFSFRLHAGERHAPLVLEKPGIVVVGCNIHDWMIAYIDVTAAPYFALTGTDGVAHLTGLPAGAWRIRVWHPGLEPGAHDYSRQLNLQKDQRAAITIRLLGALTQTGPRHPMDDAGYTDY